MYFDQDRARNPIDLKPASQRCGIKMNHVRSAFSLAAALLFFGATIFISSCAPSPQYEQPGEKFQLSSLQESFLAAHYLVTADGTQSLFFSPDVASKPVAPVRRFE